MNRILNFKHECYYCEELMGVVVFTKVRELAKSESPWTLSHRTDWFQILSELCFQRVALSGNYETVALSTDKNTFFNDLDYRADIGQDFH
jgi:hypothetical protein